MERNDPVFASRDHESGSAQDEAVLRYVSREAIRATATASQIDHNAAGHLVIAGLDESPVGYLAVDEGAREARMRAASLRIIHVQGGSLLPNRRGTVRSAGEELLAEAVERVRTREPDVAVSTRLLVGSAASELVRASAHADIVVVGNHGRSRLGDAFTGSVSSHVAAHATSPVLVARMPTRTNEQEETRYPVVVGVDGSLESWAALQCGMVEARLRGVSLLAVYASRETVPAWNDPLNSPWLTDDMANRLGVPIERRRIDADPGHALVALSAEASAVVIGSPTHVDLPGLRSGSVAQTLVRQAHSCVIVVPACRLSQPFSERPNQGGVEPGDVSSERRTTP
jgi:nucleotide-binding universal stress UspA family protein